MYQFWAKLKIIDRFFFDYKKYSLSSRPIRTLRHRSELYISVTFCNIYWFCGSNRLEQNDYIFDLESYSEWYSQRRTQRRIQQL